MNKRYARYQGAILRDYNVLIIAHREHETGRSYWLMPGGGIEPGESEEDCVRREMREETGLEVRVERLLLEKPALHSRIYEVIKIYQCSVISGEAAPGYEPEVEVAAVYGIVDVAWLDLRDPAAWPEIVRADPITYTELISTRDALIQSGVLTA